MTRTASAIAVLLAAAAAAPACLQRQHEAVPLPVETVAYAPDGTLFLFTAAGIYLYDEALQAVRRRILFEAEPSPLTAYVPHRYSLSADGAIVAVSSSPDAPGSKSRIAIFRVADGLQSNAFEIDDVSAPGTYRDVEDLALSPRGDLVYAYSYIGGRDPLTAVYDVATGRPLWIGEPFMREPVWAPDGSTLFTIGGGPVEPMRLLAFDARTGELRWRRDLALGDPEPIAVTADGAFLTGPAGVATTTPCPDPGVCPPGYGFVATADGAQMSAKQIPPLPDSSLYGTSPNGMAAFNCSTTDDICAVGLSDFSRDAARPFVMTYRSDGSIPLIVWTNDLAGSMAMSPGARYLAVADELSSNVAGVAVFRIADGRLVSRRAFTWDTF